jgi:ribosome recycling factor
MNQNWKTAGRDKLGQIVRLIADDLNSLSLGRARPALVENIRVEAYEGSILTLKELGTIAAPDPQTLLIQIWDQSIVEQVVKAIQSSGLNLNPVVDQNTIRLHLPGLTEERRHELVKAVRQKIESGRALLRQVRVELKQQIDTQKGQPGVSEDDIRHSHGELQRLVDEFNGRLEALEKNKTAELTSL